MSGVETDLVQGLDKINLVCNLGKSFRMTVNGRMADAVGCTIPLYLYDTSEICFG